MNEALRKNYLFGEKMCRSVRGKSREEGRGEERKRRDIDSEVPGAT